MTSRSTSQHKKRLFEQFARIGRALSAPLRLELLDLLSQSEKPVDRLATQTGMTIANASRHLQVLRSAGLVESRRDGLHVYYRLADPHVAGVLRHVQTLAESRLAEVERILTEIVRDVTTLEAVDREQLLQLAQRGDVLILDVRPEDEYREAHLPFALSIPLPELKQRLDALAKNRRVVAYCRGPYCVLASEAVRLLRHLGYDAVRLTDSVTDWKDAGMTLVSNDNELNKHK